VKKWQFSRNGKDWYNVDGTSFQVIQNADLPEPNEKLFTDRMNNQTLLRDLLTDKYGNYIKEASDKYSSNKYDIDENWIKAIIIQESDGNSNADGGAKCYGLMQVSLDYAAKEVLEKDLFKSTNYDWPTKLYYDYNAEVKKYEDPNRKESFMKAGGFDPRTNILLGTSYFEILQRVYFDKKNDGDDLIKISLLAYYLGPTEVNTICGGKWEGCIENKNKIGSTYFDYVSNIFAYKQALDKDIKDYNQLDLSYLGEKVESGEIKVNNQEERDIINKLESANYSAGIKILVDEIKTNGGSLETDEVVFDEEEILGYAKNSFGFEFTNDTLGEKKALIYSKPENIIHTPLRLSIGIKGESWIWYLKYNMVLAPIEEESLYSDKAIQGKASFKTDSGSIYADYKVELSPPLKEMFEELEERDIYEGAAIIFSEIFSQ
jgi:hypothetical protein